MVRGFYTAASGLVTQEKRLNAISNNIANVSTAGYKKDGVVMGTFGEHMSVRMNAYQRRNTVDIGPGVFMTTVDESYTDISQGGFEQTNRPMDFAIAGEGFFVINDAEGNPLLTRDGQFSMDEEGYLVLPGYGRVQGVEGDIQLASSLFDVDRMGNIYDRPDNPDEEATVIDRLVIAIPQDYEALAKASDYMFVSEAFDIAEPTGEQFSIRQGLVERSNVMISQEMTEMIASQRSLQSCSQIVKMYDELTEQANSRISRV